MLRWLVGTLVALLAVGLVFVYFSEGFLGPMMGPGTLVGWAIPLCTVFVVVAISWFLLARATGSSNEEDPAEVACPSCGAANLREWRMCPYCGARSASSDAALPTDEVA